MSKSHPKLDPVTLRWVAGEEARMANEYRAWATEAGANGPESRRREREHRMRAKRYRNLATRAKKEKK